MADSSTLDVGPWAKSESSRLPRTEPDAPGGGPWGTIHDPSQSYRAAPQRACPPRCAGEHSSLTGEPAPGEPGSPAPAPSLAASPQASRPLVAKLVDLGLLSLTVGPGFALFELLNRPLGVGAITLGLAGYLLLQVARSRRGVASQQRGQS